MNTMNEALRRAARRGTAPHPEPPADDDGEEFHGTADQGARGGAPKPRPSMNEHLRAAVRHYRRVAVEDYWPEHEGA